MFATIAALTIPAGRLTGEVAAVCQTAGEIGNGFIPGQITKLVDIFPYYEKAENITESAGGADWESDAAFYARIRESRGENRGVFAGIHRHRSGQRANADRNGKDRRDRKADPQRHQRAGIFVQRDGGGSISVMTASMSSAACSLFSFNCNSYSSFFRFARTSFARSVL